jgi:hypothetical protein
MKPRFILPLLIAGSVSMPAWPLAPVVDGSGAPAPNAANVQRPPSTNTIYELMSRIEQLQTKYSSLPAG